MTERKSGVIISGATFTSNTKREQPGPSALLSVPCRSLHRGRSVSLGWNPCPAQLATCLFVTVETVFAFKSSWTSQRVLLWPRSSSHLDGVIDERH